MKWIRNDLGLYYGYLEKGDIGYREFLCKNETNIFSFVSSHKRVKKYKNMTVRHIKKPDFEVSIAGVRGRLYFNRLKDAKEFAERTYKWLEGLTQGK